MNKAHLKILILLFLCTSCFLKNNQLKNFKAKSFPLLVSTLEIEKNDLYINLDKVIERPFGIFMNLLKLTNLDHGGEKSDFCLFYQIPMKDKSDGTLRLTHSDLGQCKDNFDEKIIAEIEAIKDLKVFIYDEDTILDRKRFEAQVLYFLFESNGKLETLQFPLLNYIGEPPPQWKRYSNSFENRRLKGIKVSSIGMSSQKNETRKILKTKGSFGDHYINNSLETCHNFNADCQETQEFSCHNCRYGWFSAIPNISCDKVTLKFCGNNRCGEKGMPACVRGDQASIRMGIQAKNRCYDGSPAGYCNQGLKTVCDGKILICL